MDRPAFDAPSTDWLVYADALQVAGDPRGELISLVHGADEAARDAYVHAHAEALLGAAAKAFRQGAYRLTWRHGSIDTAVVRVRSGDHGEHWVRALLGCPAAGDLRALEITGVTTDEKAVDLSHAIKAATTTAWPASLRSLALVDDRASQARTQVSREYGSDENLVQFGSLAAIWQLPQLEHLRLELADAFYVELGEIAGDNLRSFTLRTLRYADGAGGEPSPISQALGAASWPKLEELELRLAETFVANTPIERKPYVAMYSSGDDADVEALMADDDADEYLEDMFDDGDNEGVDYGELEPLFAKLKASPLRRLALTSFDSSASLLEVLARTGLPPALKVLDLSDSALRREDVEWMRAHAALFASLNELRLERTAIEPAWLDELTALGPAIVHSHQRTAPTYRYVVGME